MNKAEKESVPVPTPESLKHSKNYLFIKTPLHPNSKKVTTFSESIPKKS
jgi:hypothetical protein